jgi:spore coat polysaccharide biosynthesis protein SpsF
VNEEELGILIQARAGSTRLPGKVLADLQGNSILNWVLRRTGSNRRTGNLVVVTSELERDNSIAEHAEQLGVPVYRGSETDVLSRYVDAARHFGFSVVVRITADCPFIDPTAIDRVIDEYENCPRDYICMSGYPEGLGAAELVRTSALMRVVARTSPSDLYYREHVITYILEHLDEFEVRFAPSGITKRAELRFSIDTVDDLTRARRIAAAFHPSRHFGTSDLLAWVDANEVAMTFGRRA